MVWEGKGSYQTIDQALNDLEAGLGEIMKDW